MPIQPEFLQQEKRCGFTITAEMKAVWATQLDLLERFQAVCRYHNLRYFASGGTLLGAVRHQGYIPWDDDIDIMMLREDYDKLLAIADSEFTAPYFFQTIYNDKQYSRGHAQLRNSNTTAILNQEKGCYPFNQGVFIDIFPLDALADDAHARRKQCRAIKRWEKLLNITVRYPANPYKSPLKSLLHVLLSPIPYRFFLQKKERVCTRYNDQATQQVAPLSFLADDERLVFPADAFAQTCTVPFEHTTIDIPAAYDVLLTRQYGDYHTIRQESSYHGGILFDTTRSYLDYLR